MRATVFCILAAALCCGVDCTSLPTGQNDSTNAEVSDTPGNPPANTPMETPVSGCHTGTFMCSNGPDWTACGSWSFEITDMDTIVGSGTITLPGQSAPVALTLTGATDPTADNQEITLSSEGEGGGSMHVENVGPTLEITGDWSLSTGPEALGDEIVGEINGTSCESLP